MFTRTFALAATAVLAATAAQASPESTTDSVTATYHFDTRRFCVRGADLAAADQTRTRVHQRRCMSRQEWLQRGIRFAQPQRDTIARS